MISIVIPTYNNLDYLKLCLKSLKKNSTFKHEIIIHINDGSDGTLNFVKSNNYKHTNSDINIGLCSSINKAAKLVSNKYICFTLSIMSNEKFASAHPISATTVFLSTLNSSVKYLCGLLMSCSIYSWFNAF